MTDKEIQDKQIEEIMPTLEKILKNFKDQIPLQNKLHRFNIKVGAEQMRVLGDNKKIKKIMSKIEHYAVRLAI